MSPIRRRSTRRPITLTPAASLLLATSTCLLATNGIALAQAGTDESSLPDAVSTGTTTASATDADGPAFPISQVTVQYLRTADGQPAVESLTAVPVALTRTETGWVAGRSGLSSMESIDSLNAMTGGAGALHVSGLQAILEGIRDELESQDLLGIYVIQDPSQISDVGVDLRPAGDTSLSIVVITGIVQQVRTVAAGERVREGGTINPANRVDHPAHARIREDSPVQAGETETLLRGSVLDRYVFQLGRHPGRRVDVALAPALESGAATLDYVVTENDPFIIYLQASNTGTQSTDYWRERIGMVHTQLTNSDDVLSLEYTTAQFDDVHALTGAYERPLFGDPRLRGRVYGAFSRYDAEDIGIFAQDFTGENVTAGVEVAWNFWQKREAFLDLIGGIRYDDFEVEQTIFMSTTTNSAEFLTPYIGLRYERTTDWFQTRAQATLEYQGDILGNDASEVAGLGRTSPDDDWLIVRFGGIHSFYLEPVLDWDGWADPSTPESSTLAHEVQFRVQGQFSPDRVVPQTQGVIGGMMTVRGYPQSIVAGDSSIVGTAEYRFHLPRSFGVAAEPGELFGAPFRYAPQYVYGTPDWDLVLKGFVDVGLTDVTDELGFESSETLIGAGIGLELLYKRNLNVRLDWGFALEELDGRGVASGANRLHLLATILF